MGTCRHWWLTWKTQLAVSGVVVLLLLPAMAYSWYVLPLVPDSTSGSLIEQSITSNSPNSPSTLGTDHASRDPGRVTLLLMTTVTWDQFYGAVTRGAAPELLSLSQRGAVGLMNTNTAMYRRPNDAYVTLGAGTRARDTKGAVEEADVREQASAVYQRRMGVGPGAAHVLHLGVAALRRTNGDVDHAVTPGALGQALHDSGLPTAVFGNADVVGQANRGVVAVAMDEVGRVDWGRVGRDVLVVDDNAPGGLRTDWNAIWTDYRALPFDSGLIVIEAGDFYRLNDQAPLTAPGQLAVSRQRAFAELDAFIGDLVSTMNPERDLLIVASIAPDTASESIQDALTPVVAFGRGIKTGLLASDTTRRPGIIANVDIAPTILQHFGISPGREMVGSPVQGPSTVRSTVSVGRFGGFMRSQDALVTLDNRHAYALYNNLRRWPYLLKPYIFVYLAALILSVVALFRPALFAPLSRLLTGLMLTPLILFLLPLVGVPSGLLTALLTLGAVIVATALMELLRRVDVLIPLVVTGFVTASLVIADVYLGGQLMITSPLGYSPIVGARYYGIGNEYMGVLLGATLVGLCALADAIVLHARSTERAANSTLALYSANGLLVVGLVCAFYVVMSPTLGANLGGTISAAAGFAIVLLRIQRGPVGLRELVMAGAVATVAVVGVGVWDMSRPLASQTHIGHAFSDLFSRGATDLVAIARRKLDMNVRLFRLTMWSRVLVGSIVVFVALVYRPVGIFARVAARYPYLTAGLHGVATLTVVAFVVNDSGVVFGALSMVFGASTLIYLVAAEVLRSRTTASN